MNTLLTTLTQAFHAATRGAFPNAMITLQQIEVTQSTNPQFGHYQCNSAMKLAGVLKQKPREVAQAIVNTIKNDGIIDKCEIAGPGFINITLSADYLAKRTQLMLNDPHFGIELPPIEQRVVVDFSSPNVAKEMHVGHLRSTIIGDCLARVFEFLGYDVLRLNHIGNWGTAFGMLITYLKERVPDVLSGKRQTDLLQLMEWYKASKKVFDEDADFKKRAQLEVVALQGGNPEALKAWELICEISRRAYQEIYDLLNIRIIERGESFYNPFLPGVLQDLENKGMITVSDGAKCVYVEGFVNREGEALPLMVQKSDGGYNYASTDMAAIRHRIDVEKASRIVIVTDSGQATHFAMVFKAAEKAGYLDPAKVTMNHVPFGLVLGTDGKKFKTRSGETEKLIDLINAGIDAAKAILVERGSALTPEQLNQDAKVLGINAIKYADLCAHRTGDYTFSYERMLRFDGNTAGFLMYAYVRINGIKRKVSGDIEQVKAATTIALTHPSEIALALHLAQFADTLAQLSVDLLPHRLCEYLYALAEKFNAFFRDCRVEGVPEQNSRLLLCETTAKVLGQGMEMLGLQLVDKM
jgi:arginyl-tRNA synthetase